MAELVVFTSLCNHFPPSGQYRLDKTCSVWGIEVDFFVSLLSLLCVLFMSLPVFQYDVCFCSMVAVWCLSSLFVLFTAVCLVLWAVSGTAGLQTNPLLPQLVRSLTLQFPAPSLHHPLSCQSPHGPHPSSLLGCIHTVLPTETCFPPLLFLTKSYPSYHMGDPCPPWWFPLVHKVLVSIVWLYLGLTCCHILCCHRVWLSSFRVSWETGFVLMDLGLGEQCRSYAWNLYGMYGPSVTGQSTQACVRCPAKARCSLLVLFPHHGRLTQNATSVAFLVITSGQLKTWVTFSPSNFLSFLSSF